MDGRDVLLAALLLAVLNPLTAVPACIVLGVLYALQWPAPALSDDTGAPRHIKRLMKVVMSLMHGGDLNRPLLHATSDGSQKLLWHLSFGANMNPKVLEIMRKVKPAQSKPCTVFNYTLAFTHRGAPYWEPSFATIAPSQEVVDNCVSASVGHAENSADGEHAHPPVIANGHANGYQNGVVANGHVGVDKDDDTRSTCSEQAPGAQWAPVTGAWRALRRQLLASRAPPAVPELFRTPAGVPALHGVAHQISEEQMERIKLTEGGGGNKDMGYQMVEVDCEFYDGKQVKALAFITHPSSEVCKSVVYAHPSERYLRIIREGAAHSCLASDFQEHLATLRPYKTCTVGQVVGAYVVLSFMLTLGAPLLATLFLWRRLLRRKLDQLLVHKYTNALVSITWQLHNRMLRYALGNGC